MIEISKNKIRLKSKTILLGNVIEDNLRRLVAWIVIKDNTVIFYDFKWLVSHTTNIKIIILLHDSKGKVSTSAWDLLHIKYQSEITGESIHRFINTIN